jgi:hypothetical protein
MANEHLIYPPRTILCTTCGGKAGGCDDCDATGVQEINAPARPDGLPWHPHAVKGPTDIQAPAPVARARRVAEPTADATTPPASPRRRRAR